MTNCPRVRAIARGLVAASGLAMAQAPDPAAARIWHVAPDSTGDLPTIQAALDSAAAGDEIVLAPGIYSWRTQGESWERGTMLRFSKPVTLRGAAGAAHTILDAEQRGRVAFCGAGPTLRGLTIRGGRAPAGYPGGGLRVFGGLIAECVIADNECTGTGAGNPHGGGLIVLDGRVEDCEIVGNRVPVRGRGAGAMLVRSTMRRTRVRDNTAAGEGGSGGGVYSQESIIEDCRFDRNAVEGLSAVFGGALHSNGDRIARCSFVRNVLHAGESAGAAIYGTPLSIEESVFIGNVTPGIFATGGAVYVTTKTAVDRCTFVGNSSGVHNADVSRSIITGCSPGPPCSGSGTIACTLLFRNPTTRGACAPQDGNRSEDPQFCAVDPATSGNIALQADSPALLAECGPMGAVAAAGCEAVGARVLDFGRVKLLYRTPAP